MAIITMQRRLVEVGRLRMGEKRTSSGGKKYPAKLKHWRLTSSDRARLDAAAAIYGGQVREWESAWELATTSSVLDVAVVPGQAVSQFFEHWGQRHPRDHDGPNPVVCLLRCDGQTELLGDRPCVCSARDQDLCNPTTRLSVMLRKVPGMGLWRLDSRGGNAARELVGSVELLEMLTAANRPVRARLRIDERTSIDEEGTTHNFVVPVLDVDTTMDEILDSLQAAPVAQIGRGQQVAIPVPSFTPVPAELPEAAARSIAEQMASAGESRPRSPRANAQQPLVATGVKPRTAVEVSGDHPPGDSSVGSVGSASPDPTPPLTPDTTDDDEQHATLPLASRVAMWCGDAGLDDDGRHRFLAALTDGAISSAKDVTPDLIAEIRTKLVQVKRGELVVGERDGVPALLWAARDGHTELSGGGSTGKETRPEPSRDWSKMRVAELAAACRERGIQPAGTRSQLIALLEEAAA